MRSEVRNPFDLGYLYGISALRMFLPLYIYGCPSNFLTAFPMVRDARSQRLQVSFLETVIDSPSLPTWWQRSTKARPTRTFATR
jgi:hypothetical protein